MEQRNNRYRVPLAVMVKAVRYVEVEAPNATLARGMAARQADEPRHTWEVEGSARDRIGDLERVTLGDVRALPSTVFTCEAELLAESVLYPGEAWPHGPTESERIAKAKGYEVMMRSEGSWFYMRPGDHAFLGSYASRAEAWQAAACDNP